MSIQLASVKLESMLNQDDFQYRQAWERLYKLLDEMTEAYQMGDSTKMMGIGGKIAGFTKLRLAAARSILAECIMDDLGIVATQTLANQIMRMVFEKGLSNVTANRNFALPGRTAEVKYAPDGIRKIEDNLPLMRNYASLYRRHEKRLRAKVDTICRLAERQRKAEKQGKKARLERGQAELFV